MPIANAVKRGSMIYVYNEKGQQLFVVPAGNPQLNEGLKGYTGGSVNVQRGSFIYTYNENGQQIGMCPGDYPPRKP